MDAIIESSTPIHGFNKSDTFRYGKKKNTSLRDAYLYYNAAKAYESEGTEDSLRMAAKYYVEADINKCPKTRKLFHLNLDSADKKRKMSATKIEILKIAAENGYAPAQYSLAARYRAGIAIEKDVDKAFYWANEAASKFNVRAMDLVGDMYYKGRGVEQSYKDAFLYYRMASELGNGPAQMKIGDMYARGEFVEKDEWKAVSYYRLALLSGYIPASVHLGRIFETGDEIPRNPKIAAMYYRYGAVRGYDQAMRELYILCTMNDIDCGEPLENWLNRMSKEWRIGTIKYIKSKERVLIRK